jgi:hypothetical protein
MLRSSFTLASATKYRITAMSPKVLKPRKAKAPPMETPQPEYCFEDGLRKVTPYYQTYLAHAKGRWISRTVPDVFASEMPRRCTKNMIVIHRLSTSA